MKSISIFITFCLLFTVCMFSSCATYIDSIGKTQNLPVKQGFFNFYSDSNILIYTSTIGLTRDIEKTYPKHFEITLPKGIKYYNIAGSTDFGIYYDNNQVLFIRINLEKNELKDTMYIPTQDELQKFIQDGLTFKKSKYNIKEIDFIKNRKNLIIKKGIATILLYNIKFREYDLFYKAGNTFSFIN